MPKAPITFRETFYCPMKGAGNGMLRHLEWNAVQTELGVMVEPRQQTSQQNGAHPVTQIDMTDVAVDKISIIGDDAFFQQYGTGGAQHSDFNA